MDNISYQSPHLPSMFSDDSTEADEEECGGRALMTPIGKKVPLAVHKLKNFNGRLQNVDFYKSRMDSL